MSANKSPMDRLMEEIGDVRPGSSLDDALYRVDESYADLLEALKAMRAAFWGTSHNEAEDAANELARAAIAKAEGA